MTFLIYLSDVHVVRTNRAIDQMSYHLRVIRDGNDRWTNNQCLFPHANQLGEFLGFGCGTFGRFLQGSNAHLAQTELLCATDPPLLI